jgi:hypothetical protein
MAPPATATARSSVRARPSAAPTGNRRPPLRVFQPTPRRRSAARSFRRSTLWVAAILVVGSLLSVVVADALLTQGQVRLTSLQAQVATATATQKSLQADVAQKAAPPVVVSQAESQGLVAPAQVIYLPAVPLDVPLPVPHLTPAPPPPATPATR